MAIIHHIPGLTAEVIVNGAPLREYIDNGADHTASEVTNFIEVCADGTFEILCKFQANFTATFGVLVELRLDGNKVSSSLLRLKDLKNVQGHKFSGVKSKIGGRWYQSNLLFSPFAVGEC
jgi:hypothetical protein